MEDIESKISQILSDPGTMASILSMAKGLGLGAQAQDAAPESDGDPPQNGAADDAAPSGDLPFSIAGLLAEAGKMDGKQTALLRALKPFIKESRRNKIDRAMKAARISHIAGYAIKNLGQKE